MCRGRSGGVALLRSPATTRHGFDASWGCGKLAARFSPVAEQVRRQGNGAHQVVRQRMQQHAAYRGLNRAPVSASGGQSRAHCQRLPRWHTAIGRTGSPARWRCARCRPARRGCRHRWRSGRTARPRPRPAAPDARRAATTQDHRAATPAACGSAEVPGRPPAHSPQRWLTAPPAARVRFEQFALPLFAHRWVVCRSSNSMGTF